MNRAGVLLGALFIAACGGSSDGASAPRADEPPIAGVWRTRCGKCHVRVEPGTRSREHIEEALSRHKNRVRLRDPEWSELVDFLAPSPEKAQ